MFGMRGTRGTRVVTALAAAGLLAGSMLTAAPASAARAEPSPSAGLRDCVGQYVGVDGRGRVLTYDLFGTARGVTASLRGVDGRLDRRPRAFAFAGEGGDIGSGMRTHFAVTQSGRLQRIVVTTSGESGYVAQLSTQTIARGFAPAAMAAQVDVLADDAGFVYAAGTDGALRRYSYSAEAGLGRGVVVARGLGRVGDLEFGRYLSTTSADGTSTTTADVLTATDARTGALREITVPYAGRTARVAVLKASGFAAYRHVQSLQCPGQAGGFVAIDSAGRGTAFLDRDATDGRGSDIVRVGAVVGRVTGVAAGL